MTKLVVALGFLALNVYTYQFLAEEAVIPSRRGFEAFPLELGEWSCAQRVSMDEKIERRLGVTDYLLCDFFRPGAPALVNVYVGYHATQVREGAKSFAESSIHPPAHCLPGSGWNVIRSQTVLWEDPGLPGPPRSIKRLVIAKDEARAVVYYWYQSRGRVIAEDWQKILYMGWDRATRQRSDGSLVRFTAPVVRGDEGRADATIRDLMNQIVPQLPPFLPG